MAYVFSLEGHSKHGKDWRCARREGTSELSRGAGSSRSTKEKALGRYGRKQPDDEGPHMAGQEVWGVGREGDRQGGLSVIPPRGDDMIAREEGGSWWSGVSVVHVAGVCQAGPTPPVPPGVQRAFRQRFQVSLVETWHFGALC